MSPATKEAFDLKKLIHDVPDFPRKGIAFKDITPLLADPKGFRAMVEQLASPWKGKGIKKVAGVESRGFILAAAVAYSLDAGVVLVRKKGKLPRRTIAAEYALEYGTDVVEAHADAVEPGAQVLIVDDVLATGGTASATCQLIGKLGAKISGLSFLIELDFLKGREKLKGQKIHSLVHY